MYEYVCLYVNVCIYTRKTVFIDVRLVSVVDVHTELIGRDCFDVGWELAWDLHKLFVPLLGVWRRRRRRGSGGGGGGGGSGEVYLGHRSRDADYRGYKGGELLHRPLRPYGIDHFCVAADHDAVLQEKEAELVERALENGPDHERAHSERNECIEFVILCDDVCVI